MKSDEQEIMRRSFEKDDVENDTNKSSLNPVTAQRIEPVIYAWNNLQDEAEQHLPLGWCYACVSKAKNAEANNQPAEPIRAAVTNIPQVTTLMENTRVGKQPDTGMGVLQSCIHCI